MAPHSKSRELANMLKFQIVSGELTPGCQLETVSKLAHIHNTTVATVSKALDYLEQQQLIERLPGKGVYVKAKRSVRIAVVLDNLFDYSSNSYSYLPILIREIDRKCNELEWSYELFCNVKDHKNAADFVDKLTRNTFDVVFIDSLYIAQNYETIFKNISIFTIGIYNYKELSFSFGLDSYCLSYDAVIELDKLGCKEIALFSINRSLNWSKTPSMLTKGYYDALARIGKLQSNAKEYALELSQQGGFDGFMQLLGELKTDRKIGIICVDSTLTDGVIQAALSQGYKIPEQITIASHLNMGCGSGRFAIPVIAYEYRVNEHMNKIFDFIKSYTTGEPPPYGNDLMKPVKVLPAKKTKISST